MLLITPGKFRNVCGYYMLLHVIKKEKVHEGAVA